MTRPVAWPQGHEDSHIQFKWVSLVALCTAMGLGSVAIADAASRQGGDYVITSVFFWVGLLLIFAPIAFRILSNNVHPHEQLALVVLLGVALYVAKLLGSPDAFTGTDEYVHLRNTQDILRTQHVFNSNPLLPTAAFYPGLGAATAGLADLTGLSPFVSGVLIIGAGRILISACFFLVAERATGSARAAAGASLVYAANPLFLFWSSTFAYENLALPLAAFVIWWLGRVRQEAGPGPQIVATVAIVAVTVTHHVAGFALAALLSAWWLAELVIRRSGAELRNVGFMAAVAGVSALSWLLLVAKPAQSYLFTNNLVPELQQTVSVLTGRTPPRHLFTSGGHVSPAWEIVASFGAISVLLLALPLALYLAWTQRPRPALAVAISVAVIYPFTLLPRLAPSGVAISGRSSEYVFAGLGCVLGLLTAEATWWRRTRRRLRPVPAARTRWFGWRWVAVAAALTTFVFVGGVTIGTAFYERLPESANPPGYPWSVQPDVVSASQWSRDQLGINQRFAANWIDASALATYGEQDTVNENYIWPIFFADTMDATVVQSIRSTGVRYLLVDWRMIRGVPPTPGYYFSPYEPHAGNYKQAFSAGALQKFASAACTRLIYDTGSIQIFDVTLIENGSCVPALSGAARNDRSPG
ncbi:MAG TPA: hypothetical protein VGS16_11505 [Candidatus Dormibacteraeota bacterium]|nr:hypothetical protein [Candidatus Dormibacteraeota bacterium]